MRGGVARVLDEARLELERLAHERPEARLGEVGCERGLVGALQRPVVREQPGDGRLQREPRVEGAAARIRQRLRLRPGGVAEDLGELGLQEGELRHEGATRDGRGLPFSRGPGEGAPTQSGQMRDFGTADLARATAFRADVAA